MTSSLMTKPVETEEESRTPQTRSYRIPSLWKQWITPRASDPEEAFREQTIRAVFPIVLSIWLLFYVLFNLLGWVRNSTSEIVIFGTVVLFYGYALWKQAVTAAGFLLVTVLVYALYTTVSTSFWFDANIPVMMLIVFAINIILPRSYLFPSIFGLLIFFAAFAFTQDAAGMRPGDLTNRVMETPLVTTIIIGMLLLLEGGMLYYLRTEFDNRFAQVQHLNATLEQRVKARTRDIELSSVVSRQITTMLDLDQLLKAIADQTKEAFQLYHVSVYLFDQEQERLLLAAGAGVVGEQMRKEGKSFLWFSDKGIVPEAARIETSVLVNDVGSDTRYLPNPLLPDTRSELAVPMIASGKRIGVLDLQANTPKHFNDDIVRVMSMLAEQLAIAVENATLFDEVERARQEQVAMTEQLRAVDSMKSQFLASMSHELRTPLNAILNFTKFVQTGMLGTVNDKQKDALTKTINSGKHLLALINDVLDITKIESNMLNLFVEKGVSLADELETTAATAETLLGEKPDVTFVRDYDLTQLPDIICDRRRVRQILLNLVSNACKFTEKGQVKLGARVDADAGQIHLMVRDTGPGIAAEDHAMIFEPFRQSHAGMSKGGGTGLGLPIARRLAEAHGGRLSMESTVGQGTTFSVVLPIASAELSNLIKVGK